MSHCHLRLRMLPPPIYWYCRTRPLQRSSGDSSTARKDSRSPSGLPSETIELLRPVIAAKGIPTLVSTYDVLGEGVFYSTVRLIDGDGEIRTEYRQAHALNLPNHHERLFFQPGTTGHFPLFDVNGVQIGLLLGGDLWVPESARSLALAGADALICMGAFAGELESKARTLAEARSIENGIPVLLANQRTGSDCVRTGRRSSRDRS